MVVNGDGLAVYCWTEKTLSPTGSLKKKCWLRVCWNTEIKSSFCVNGPL